MGQARKGSIRLLLGTLCVVWGCTGFAPTAKAQFFWWFDQPKKAAPKPRVKPKPPGDDLPPIVPRESSAPPPPDDRPYDAKLMRLAEILGAVHYLRELCGAQEGQIWRDQMKDILRNEGTTAVRRAKLVNAFNDGYRGYRRTYRTCTQSATLATARFSTEGATIAASLAQGSTVAAKAGTEAKIEPEGGGQPDVNGTEAVPPETADGDQTGGLPDGSQAMAPGPEPQGLTTEEAPTEEPPPGESSSSEEPPD